jgi:hypothetical protein
VRRFGKRQVALAGVQDDRLVTHEFGDCDRVGDVVGEGSVAAVGDGPLGAADGGGAVAAAGAELAVGAGLEQLKGLAGGDRGVGGLVGLAVCVGRRGLERTLTSLSVTKPLWAWVSLKIAPPNVPCWVLPFWPVDVINSSEPWRASICAPEGICSAPVSGTNFPLILISTNPLTGVTFTVLPRIGALGAGAAAVVKVASGPAVVPALLLATNRTW